MITLTRLSGSAFALNSDLIERVDSTPDTVVTLVDGTKYVVRETLEQIVDSVRDFRGQVIARAHDFEAAPTPSASLPPAPPRLTAVSSRPGAREDN